MQSTAGSGSGATPPPPLPRFRQFPRKSSSFAPQIFFENSYLFFLPQHGPLLKSCAFIPFGYHGENFQGHLELWLDCFLSPPVPRESLLGWNIALLPRFVRPCLSGRLTCPASRAGRIRPSTMLSLAPCRPGTVVSPGIPAKMLGFDCSNVKQVYALLLTGRFASWP